MGIYFLDTGTISSWFLISSFKPCAFPEIFSFDFGIVKNNIKMEVTDISGKTIISKNFVSQSNCLLDVSGLSKGIYLVKVNADGEDFVKQVIKN